MNPHVTPLLLLSHDPNAPFVLVYPGHGGSSSEGGLIGGAIDAGYAFAVGHVGSPASNQRLNPASLIAALRAGWTWGEAMAVATPTINSTWRPIGDPLAGLPLPKAGWDVYGPVARLDDIDLDFPTVSLREDELTTALDTAMQPSNTDPVVYLIRHVDDLGRAESGSTVVRTAKLNGLAKVAPSQPVWPDTDGWPVWVEKAKAQPLITWDRSLRECNVDTVDLIVIDSQNTEQIAATITPLGHHRYVRVVLDLPNEPIRIKWRITSHDGVTLETPWSQMIQSPPVATVSLQLTTALT